MRFALFCAWGLATIIGCPSRTAEAQPTGTLLGRVIDGSTGQPVPSAQVIIAAAGRLIVTGEDGTFTQRLIRGPHEVYVRRTGYSASRDTVRLGESETVRIEVALTPVPAVLPQVAVEAPRSYLGGFWERKQHNIGHFFTREDFDRRKPYRLVEMLHGVSGAKILPTPQGHVIASARGPRTFSTNDCIAAVFVDGVPYQMSIAGLDDIMPDDVAAMEYYSSPARLPAQFSRATGMSRPATGQIAGHPKCGVLVIWSRGRS